MKVYRLWSTLCMAAGTTLEHYRLADGVLQVEVPEGAGLKFNKIAFQHGFLFVDSATMSDTGKVFHNYKPKEVLR